MKNLHYFNRLYINRIIEPYIYNNGKIVTGQQEIFMNSGINE